MESSGLATQFQTSILPGLGTDAPRIMSLSDLSGSQTMVAACDWKPSGVDFDLCREEVTNYLSQTLNTQAENGANAAQQGGNTQGAGVGGTGFTQVGGNTPVQQVAKFAPSFTREIWSKMQGRFQDGNTPTPYFVRRFHQAALFLQLIIGESAAGTPEKPAGTADIALTVADYEALVRKLSTLKPEGKVMSSGL